MKKFIFIFVLSLFSLLGCQRDIAHDVDTLTQMTESGWLKSDQIANYEFYFAPAGTLFARTEQNQNPEYVAEWKLSRVAGDTYMYIYYGEFDYQKFHAVNIDSKMCLKFNSGTDSIPMAQDFGLDIKTGFCFQLVK